MGYIGYKVGSHLFQFAQLRNILYQDYGSQKVAFFQNGSSVDPEDFFIALIQDQFHGRCFLLIHYLLKHDIELIEMKYLKKIFPEYILFQPE